MSNQCSNAMKLEKRRLDRLKKELDRQEKKLNEEKLKLQQEMHELRIEQNQIEAYKLTETKLKSELEKVKKEKREIRKLYERSQSAIKSLKRKVNKQTHSHSRSQSSKKHSFNNNDNDNSAMDRRNNRIRRNAKKEVTNMKKRLRLAMNDMDKQARYYEAQIKNIKLQHKQKERNHTLQLQRKKSGKSRSSCKHLPLGTENNYSCGSYYSNYSGFSPKSAEKFKKYSLNALSPKDSNTTNETTDDESNQSNHSAMFYMNIDEILHELLNELCNNAKDLKELHLFNENMNGNKHLLQQIKRRHCKFMERLNELQFDENLQHEIQEIMTNYENGMCIQNELHVVTNNIFINMNKAIAVLKNEQPKELLDEIITENSNNEWIDIFKSLDEIYNDMNEKKAHYELYLKTMRANSNSNINWKNKTNKLKINYYSSPEQTIANEHSQHTNNPSFHSLKSFDIDDSFDNNEMICNSLYVSLSPTMRSISGSNVSVATLSQNISMELLDEMRERRKDIEAIQMLHILNDNNEMDIINDEELENIKQSAKKRHSLSIHKLLNELKEYELYNEESNIIEKLKKDNVLWQKELDKLSKVIQNKSNQSISHEHVSNNNNNNNVWWLHKNEEITTKIKQIELDSKQKTEIQQIQTYINTILKLNDRENERDDQKTDHSLVASLYFPLPSHLQTDPNEILLALLDGVILCRLVNTIISNESEQNEFIDWRAIHSPEICNPNPMCQENIIDNLQLLLSCVKAINISLDTYNATDLLQTENIHKLAKIFIDIIYGLSMIHLSNKININKHNELVRLVKNKENTDVISMISGKQWIQRWINYLNGDRVLTEINTKEFNYKLFTAMKLQNNKHETEENIVYELIEFSNIEWMNTNTNTNDLLSHNSYLQYLFAANLFEIKNGYWSVLSNDEKISYKQQIKSVSFCISLRNDYLLYIEWINSILCSQCNDNYTIINNFNNLCNGYILLQLLDLFKPSCIEWDNITMDNKLTNCNIVIHILEKEFGFIFDGYIGNDIVNGNYKMIQLLLAQLMRYYSTIKLATLLSLTKEQSVSEFDILTWANLTINECEYSKSNELKSFNDTTLCTNIFYCELLKAIKPNCINLDMICYDCENNIENDKYNKLRLYNAKYVISMIRRFGIDIFVTPNSLINIEYNSVFSVFASIMTIAISEQQNI